MKFSGPCKVRDQIRLGVSNLWPAVWILPTESYCLAHGAGRGVRNLDIEQVDARPALEIQGIESHQTQVSQRVAGNGCFNSHGCCLLTWIWPESGVSWTPRLHDHDGA